MNYGTISRKSSGKSKSEYLPIALCLLFFLIYFSFLIFFRYTQSVAFFQYLILLFIISTAVSLIYSFFTKKAWIPLILQLAFGGICWGNYNAFQSTLKERQTEMGKICREKHLEAETMNKAVQDRAKAKPGSTEKIILTRTYVHPLLFVEGKWLFQVMSLGEVIVSDRLHSPDQEFTNGKPGWITVNTIISGYYFGLSYYVTPPITHKSDGVIRPAGNRQGDLIKINNGLRSCNDWFESGIIVEEKKSTCPHTLTLHFSLDLDIAGRIGKRQSMGGATWTYIPPAPPKESKRNIEFR